MRSAAVIVVLALAAGCAAKRGAPVFDRCPEARPGAVQPRTAAKPAPRAPAARAGFYTVRAGDTLYSIALDHGLDYRELASWNGISDPAVIQVGQPLRLTSPGRPVAAAPMKTAPGVEGRPLDGSGVKTQPKATREPYSEKTHAQTGQTREPAQVARVDPRPPSGVDGQAGALTFAWPARGRVVGSFNDRANMKGIGIAGKLGEPVLASAAGRVIFSGTGIRGFGKLIVIKHNDTFLSVYAHNSALLVKEGENVTRGQKIAEMGATDTDEVKLHFEIRRFGKPVDPMQFLPPA
jgi:lipoprotein NlpD